MNVKMTIYVRLIAITVFGIVFPVIVLFQAHGGIQSLNKDVAYTTNIVDLSSHVATATKERWKANDYALFSLLYVEHANQKTMINKQVMKTAIVNIGFAVMSIGLMLIVLGIERGGADSTVTVRDISFNIKTGSSGVAIFIVGAIMATLGGVLKNDYQTSQIPDYEHVPERPLSPALLQSREAYSKCSTYGESFETCFAQAFFQINSEALK